MRLVTSTDAPGIARLIHEVWPDHNPNPARIARVSLESGHTTVIEADGSAVIGFADGFTTVSSDGVLRWEVDLLGVQPAYRGRGIAQALIAASVEAGRRAGAVTARALVEIENAPSQAAFRRCGFTASESIYELFVSGESLRGRLLEPPGAHLVSVATLTYGGVWVEGKVSFEALRCAQRARTRYGWDVAGTVIPEETIEAERVGYERVGRYRWLQLAL
jgi:ribosomal protein S18 acetylase RimI-like enzyme